MHLDTPLKLNPEVLGERLAESRRARGLTQQDAADAIGVARTTITAIEKGTRKPRASELARLLLLYGRSVAEFVQSGISIDTPPFLVQFRDPGGIADTNKSQAVVQFEQLCRWYRELEIEAGIDERDSLPPPYSMDAMPPVMVGEMIASTERNRLGIGDGPITDLWGLLESDVGIRIFSFPMPRTTIAGMVVYSSELGACIALNANHPVERQRWSLAHEYAHLLTDRYKAEISVLRSRHRARPSERVADAFARHFLMPTTGLVRRFHLLQQERKGRMTPTELLQLSQLFGVSVEAMTHRLEDLALIPDDTWDRLQEHGFKPRRAQQILGMSQSETGKPRFPLQYVALCVRAFQAGELSEGQLAERLLCDRVEARRIVAEMSGTEVLNDDGVIRQLSLDLGLELGSGSR